MSTTKKTLLPFIQTLPVLTFCPVCFIIYSFSTYICTQVLWLNCLRVSCLRHGPLTLCSVFSYGATVQLATSVNVTLIQYFHQICHWYSSFVLWPNYVLVVFFPTLVQDLALESSIAFTSHDSLISFRFVLNFGNQCPCPLVANWWFLFYCIVQYSTWIGFPSIKTYCPLCTRCFL